MYYPDELVEEVRSRNDIVDVISSYIPLQKKGNSYFGLCPFHNEKTPSFSVSPDKQMYYCFGCGAGGNVITFLMEYENYTFPEALKVLADRVGIKLPEDEPDAEEKAMADKRTAILEVNKLAANYFYHTLFQEDGLRGYQYLKGRGLADDTIRRFGLGFAPRKGDALCTYLRSKGYSDALLRDSGLIVTEEKGSRDKFWNRVMFPIMDKNNRVIGFGGRVLGDGKPKYLNSPDTPVFDKSRNLYGYNYARTSREKYMLLCEGYMDVIAMQQAGFVNTVASLGTAFTPGQAMLLKRSTDQVILAYDADDAGVSAALRAIPILQDAGISAKVLDLSPYNDPDEFIKKRGADALRERISKAENSFLFEVEIKKREFDLSDPAQKTEFYHSVAEMLLTFDEPLERDNYIQAVSRGQDIPYEELRRLVNSMGSRRGYRASGATAVNSDRSGRRKRDTDEGIRDSQRLLLTWLCQRPELYEFIKGVITPADFDDDLLRQTAELLFEQLKAGSCDPAEILDHFINDDEQYKVVAGFFNAPFTEPADIETREKVLNETVYRIRKNSLDIQSRNAVDVVELQQLIKEQAALKKLHITINGS